MKIISKQLVTCKRCGYCWGFVNEKYNGQVAVFCYCDLESHKVNTFNTAIVGYRKNKLAWKPISNYKNKNGDWIHVPHFHHFHGTIPPKHKKNNNINKLLKVIRFYFLEKK